MAKKHRTGNREPRKPKQPKVVRPTNPSIADLVRSRASSTRGAG